MASTPPLPKGFLLLFGHAASRAFLGRRGLVLLLLAALPAILAWIQVRYDSQVTVPEFVGLMLMFAFQFIVLLVGLFLGVAVLGDEIEGRTLTYLFTRPQPRPLVFLARYLGVATAFALLLLGTLSAAAFLYSSRVPITARQAAATAGIGVLGFLVYAAFFAALRVFVQRALFAGFAIGFIFEGAVSKLPGTGIARWSVWHHLALLEVRLFGAGTPASNDLGDLLKGIAPDETATGSLVVLASILVVSLAAGAWRLRSQETRLANAST